MKKYGKLILLSIGVVAFLASCQCKTCTRTAEPTYTVCKDQGTDQEYNDLIDFYVAAGYDCK
jgi:hypothetical protein